MPRAERPFYSVVLAVLTLPIFSFGVVSCEEDELETDEPLTEETSPPSQRDTMTFNKSAFSQFVELSEDRKFVRVAFSFFPDGTDVDFERKMVGVPCTFPSNFPDDVNIGLSAPIEAECDAPYVVSFPEPTSLFTLNGIVMAIESADMKFEPDFGIRLTPDGIRDSFDGSLLSSSGGTLEDFYQLVIDKRD